jgi:hypothetical protein
MSYLEYSKALLNTKVHVATQTDGVPVKVFKGLKPLCGTALKDNSVVLTLSDFEFGLFLDEYICPLCLEHEDYPLLMLANVDD